MKVCHKCRREIPFETRVLRSEECPWCAAPLHVCKNCTFHDPSLYNECREVGTERVQYRDEANFCNSFVYREGEVSDAESEAEKAKRLLGGLFKI
jgi:hypothetical protein